MANGEGALVAQQRAAVEIPYRNLELSLRESQQALGAFYMGTQISKQQRAVQAAMDKLQLENEKLAFQDKWHEENYARLSEANRISNEIREENAARQWTALNEKWQRYKDMRDDDAEATGYIAASGVRPGDPDYPTVALEAKHLFRNSSIKIDDLMRVHNSARDDHEKAVLSKETTILHTFGENWAGIPNWGNARIFTDPTQTVPTYKTEEGVPAVPPEGDTRLNTNVNPATGKKYNFLRGPDGKYIESDQVAIPVPQLTAAGTTWSKFLVPKKEMLRIQQQLNALNEEKKTIGAPFAVPSKKGVIPIRGKADFDRLEHGDAYSWRDPKTGKVYQDTKP